LEDAGAVTKESPIKTLNNKGTRNLIAISKSNVPETLVEVLAAGVRSNDMIVAAIEAISSAAVYSVNALRFSQMGVIKDLVRIFTERNDFRAYIVSAAMDAVWNIVEVAGRQSIKTLAQELHIVSGLRRPFVNIMEKGYKLDDKCLRNEVAILINYVIMEKESHPFVLNREQFEDGKSLFDSLLYFGSLDEFYSLEQGENIHPG
jgi:hypothetical protein